MNQETAINEPNTSAPDEMQYFVDEYRHLIRTGLIVIGAFFLLLFIASVFIRFSGAVTAQATVVQTGKNKSVQHAVGGPIKEILVTNGDQVSQGDPLLVLDGGAVRSRLHLFELQAFEKTLILQRLQSMQRGETTFTAAVPKEIALTPNLQEIVGTQESLFIAQRDTFTTIEAEIETSIQGLIEEKFGLHKQLTANEQQLLLLEENVGDLSVLYEKQLISKSRLVAAETEKIGVQSQIEALKVRKIQTQNSLTDARERLETMRKEQQQQLWTEIETSKQELAAIEADISSTKGDFERLEITAPVSGKVHELSINNTNAVVSPNEVILQIVPSAEGLVIHSRVDPADIEQIFIQQEARIRFDSFDAQKTPEIKGQVIKIAADSTIDPATNVPYFLVTVSLDTDEIAKITTGEVIPGLPVSTMFTTNERTMMSYLLKPITTQLFKAFRE